MKRNAQRGNAEVKYRYAQDAASVFTEHLTYMWKYGLIQVYVIQMNDDIKLYITDITVLYGYPEHPYL